MAFENTKGKKIYDAQVEIIYQQIPTNLLPAIIITSVVSWTVWSAENAVGLTLWLVANYFCIALRFLSYKAFNKRTLEPEKSLVNWARLALFQLLIYGILWGLMPILFVDFGSENVVSSLAVYFFATAGMIGLTVSHSSFKPIWFAYVIPAAGSMITLLFLSSHAGTNLMALYLILFVFFLYFMMSRNHRSFREVILLKFEYSDLLVSLQKEKEKSDLANINKSTFLASASHDLRQPVHAMNLFIEMLQKKQLPDDAKLLINRIASSATNLQSLFNSLLDISSLDAGTVDINRKVINIAECLDDLYSLHAPEIENKKLDMHIDASNITVFTDPVLLTRILSNLLVNAINYTDHGSVTLSAEVVDQSVLISVKDTGKGISEENLEYIFDEFRQLHNPERDRNKGLGLGLAICRRLAAMLGTEITVTSKLGKGSSFSLVLPLDNRKKERAAIKEAAPAEIELSPYAIMIVDDEKDIRDAMPMLLASWGCQNVAAVSDEAEAKAAIEAGFAPDLVVADYRLRDNYTGLKVVELVSALLGYKVRAILITGDTAPESLLKIRESGLATLHKPIIINQLKSAIAEALL